MDRRLAGDRDRSESAVAAPRVRLTAATRAAARAFGATAFGWRRRRHGVRVNDDVRDGRRVCWSFHRNRPPRSARSGRHRFARRRFTHEKPD